MEVCVNPLKGTRPQIIFELFRELGYCFHFLPVDFEKFERCGGWRFPGWHSARAIWLPCLPDNLLDLEIQLTNSLIAVGCDLLHSFCCFVS